MKVEENSDERVDGRESGNMAQTGEPLDCLNNWLHG